ncbi:hypothetical protein FQV27_03915 [Paracoccus aurantiacus]|uniref:Heme NO-binding domain-containing protein n=1 Tax=Paracoccus aurantiacus TaxID=2599412 RepID=A0A5C6SAG0_9RHOB|nr:heme NO-binding domain-containing protein [Paracoccus aurantiacus]TXB71002.1 hypothetical protein FQV27_03915 [Paracoccus aurantiacus]
MHGFIIRGIELFLRARHGDWVWASVCAATGLDRRGTQIMKHYQQDMVQHMILAAGAALQMERDELLEDIGGWIPRLDGMRHIMRFSGSRFEDFVLSLDDLQDRASVVLPGLNLPRITTYLIGAQHYRLAVQSEAREWYPVLAGLLRGMADDYGVLAMVEREGGALDVQIADDRFAEGSDFSFAQQFGVAT